jgi:hypothetical protein
MHSARDCTLARMRCTARACASRGGGVNLVGHDAQRGRTARYVFRIFRDVPATLLALSGRARSQGVRVRA